MSGTASETLTAALRRLNVERASGLLSVATPGRDVVIELTDGTPTAIGPRPDPIATQPPAVADAAAVEELVERIVASIVEGEGAWAWDVVSNAPMVAVPDGLGAQLSRRAVDAAQAFSTLDEDALLAADTRHAVLGQVATLHGALDEQRTLGEVAEAIDRPLSTVATWAAALLDAGAARRLDVEPSDGGSSWLDTVAAADEDDVDDSDDEPELWVMEGQDPPEPEPEPEPEPAPPAPATPAPTPVASAPTPEPASSVDDWDDTAWLDELDEDPLPTRGVSADDVGAMLGELGREPAARPAPAPAAAPAATPVADASPDDGEDAAEEPPPPQPAKPRPAGDVADFLRELTHLALDDE